VNVPTATVLGPGSGTGLSPVFTAGYQDPTSYSNITEAQILVQNGQSAANSCNARYYAGSFWLR
jgi:hypothetical protein